jgi:putative YhbY family RNA-binding protein
MAAPTLTPAQRKEHRAAAHHLNPVAMVGGDGLTPAVVREIDAALKAHGLVKVRVFSDDRAAREAMLADLATRLDAAPVQHIGKLLVLWRPLPPKEPPAAAQGERGAAPRTVKLVSFSKSGNHRATVRKVTVLGNERVTPGGLIKRVRSRTGTPKTAARKKPGG